MFLKQAGTGLRGAVHPYAGSAGTAFRAKQEFPGLAVPVRSSVRERGSAGVQRRDLHAHHHAGHQGGCRAAPGRGRGAARGVVHRDAGARSGAGPRPPRCTFGRFHAGPPQRHGHVVAAKHAAPPPMHAAVAALPGSVSAAGGGGGGGEGLLACQKLVVRRQQLQRPRTSAASQ